MILKKHPLKCSLGRSLRVGWRTGQYLNFMIETHWLANCLLQHKIRWRAGEVPRQEEGHCIAGRAQPPPAACQIVYWVQCWIENLSQHLSSCPVTSLDTCTAVLCTVLWSLCGQQPSIRLAITTPARNIRGYSVTGAEHDELVVICLLSPPPHTHLACCGENLSGEICWFLTSAEIIWIYSVMTPSLPVCGLAALITSHHTLSGQVSGQILD